MKLYYYERFRICTIRLDSHLISWKPLLMITKRDTYASYALDSYCSSNIYINVFQINIQKSSQGEEMLCLLYPPRSFCSV